MAGFKTITIIGLSALVAAGPSTVGTVPDAPDNYPMQIHVAYAGETGMRVSWNTYGPLDTPTVRYGLLPWALDGVASSSDSTTYPTSTTYNNHVKIDGLIPDTQYFYTIEHDNATNPYTFKTSRPAGDPQPFTVALAVDLGTMGPLGLTTYTGKGAANPLAPGEQNTIQSLQGQKDNYDFLFHPGDLAYADAWLKEEIGGFLPNTTIDGGAAVYEAILNAFYDEMAVVSAYKPYMVGPGNHEANCDNGGTKDKSKNITYTESICMVGQTNFTGYINHFRMPSDVSGGVGNFWYSFDHGLAHFVTINTETDLGAGLLAPDAPGGSQGDHAGPFGSYPNAQIDWLKKDLASVDRTKTPWVIVGLHRPWYINTSGPCTVCQTAFEDILYENNVDLVVTGHAHVYQRNAPIYQGVADPNELNNPRAPWYITNGAAGHYDGLDTFTTPLASYVRAAIDTTYGWSRLVFHNATHLTQEFVASNNDTVLDSATLFKQREGCV